MTTCEFAAIGWVIALTIALYANQQANRRETRKETRDQLNQLNITLGVLLDAANNYYLNSEALASQEIIKIHESLNICYRLIEYFAKIKAGIILHQKFYIIFELVTGGDFESDKHLAGEHYTKLCKEVATKKESLIIDSENWFKKNYQNN